MDTFGNSFVSSFVWGGTRDRSAFAAMHDALEFREAIGGDTLIMQYNAGLAKWAARFLSSRWGTTNFLSDVFFSSMSDVVLPSTNSTALQMMAAALLEEFGINTSGRGSCANPSNSEPGNFPGQSGCYALRLSAQVYLEKADFVKLGDLVVQLLQRFDPGFSLVPLKTDDIARSRAPMAPILLPTNNWYWHNAPTTAVRATLKLDNFSPTEPPSPSPLVVKLLKSLTLKQKVGQNDDTAQRWHAHRKRQPARPRQSRADIW